MLIDNGSLDAPFNMGDDGRVELVDVTETLFPALYGLEVSEIEALTLRGKQVGLRLSVDSKPSFQFWVDGDELHWGDEAALRRHPWCDGEVPMASSLVQD